VRLQVTTQWKHKKGQAQLKQKKLQQLHYVSGAQGKAQVAGIFDNISNSQHGANNGMLKHKAIHKPKAALVDPTLTPVRGIFDSEGNGDVSAKAHKQNLRAVKSAGNGVCACECRFILFAYVCLYLCRFTCLLFWWRIILE